MFTDLGEIPTHHYLCNSIKLLFTRIAIYFFPSLQLAEVRQAYLRYSFNLCYRFTRKGGKVTPWLLSPNGQGFA
jgi:hypothetical protein